MLHDEFWPAIDNRIDGAQLFLRGKKEMADYFKVFEFDFALLTHVFQAAH